jgi:hypothetical protein
VAVTGMSLELRSELLRSELLIHVYTEFVDNQTDAIDRFGESFFSLLFCPLDFEEQ